MKYTVNRIKVGQTIRARSQEHGGTVVMTIQRIRWKESVAVIYDAAGRMETLNPFDWVELEDNNDDDILQGPA
jgi:hypothetical protein